MQLIGNFKYLGLETFQGKKDPTQSYSNLALLQGTDVTKIFLDTESLVRVNALGLKAMDNVLVTLKITVGTKTYVSLEDIQLAK